LEPLLKLEAVNKSFYGVQVLKDVNFDLSKGEVHALLGENGAGKSTLIKIVSGAYELDSGTIIFDGTKLAAHYGPKMAEDLGIVTIYQHFHLIPHLSVAENIALRRFTSRSEIFINWRRVSTRARAVLEKMNFPVDPQSKVKDLSVAKKQMLEIAIALSKNARIIIMDEPTAALSEKETEVLFEMIGRLRTTGIGIIYVSHKLEEIKQIADRVTILRDGNKIATLLLKDAEVRDIIGLMIGRNLTASLGRTKSGQANTLLSVQGIKTEHFVNPVNFSLRENEILGITGLVGSGKTELAQAVFGVDAIRAGKIYLEDREMKVGSPRQAVQAGIGYLPEDRDSKGLCLNMGIRENITLALLAKGRRIFFDRGAEKKLVGRLVKAIKIRAVSVFQQVKYLSGGNKQKVVLGKWLEAGCRVLILDEPTIGIDIGARREIYELVERFIGKAGRAVIFISSDVNEIVEIAHRILVMSKYNIVAELDPERTSKEEIIRYSMRLAGESA
jgi:ribose transport system ATP-binding protein